MPSLLTGDDPEAELDWPPVLHLLRGGHGAARRLHLRLQDHGGRLPVQPGANRLLSFGQPLAKKG